MVESHSNSHANLFFQEKLLLNGIDLKIKFIRAKNEFCLMRNTVYDFRIDIVSARLFVKTTSYPIESLPQKL